MISTVFLHKYIPPQRHTFSPLKITFFLRFCVSFIVLNCLGCFIIQPLYINFCDKYCILLAKTNSNNRGAALKFGDQAVEMSANGLPCSVVGASSATAAAGLAGKSLSSHSFVNKTSTKHFFFTNLYFHLSHSLPMSVNTHASSRPLVPFRRAQ